MTPRKTDRDRLRDDQMNTSVIAALIGGFALTNMVGDHDCS